MSAFRLFLLGLVLVCIGCGNSARVERPPTLPRAIAASLAGRADRVAALATAGDTCAAAAEADALQRDTIAAINARRVPGPLQEPLQGAANDLASRLVCIPPAPSEPDHAAKGDKHEQRGKGHGDNGHGGDD